MWQQNKTIKIGMLLEHSKSNHLILKGELHTVSQILYTSSCLQLDIIISYFTPKKYTCCWS